jgi:plastocyanin
MQFIPAVLSAQVQGADESTMSFWPHFVRWIGHFHPALTAFPIALLLAAALAELLRLWRGTAWLDGASRWCVIVGAVAAIITAPLGWAFALSHGSSKLLEIHRWLGTAAGVGAVVILILSEMARRPRRGGFLIAFRIVLFVAVPLVIATGFIGGAMIYGLHAYAWNTSKEHHAVDATATTQPAKQPPIIVMTDDDVFIPDKLTIAEGASVLWKNQSKTDTHTVTTDPQIAADPKDVSSPPGAATFNSGKIKPGQSFTHQFTVPGVYKYICEPHEMMGMAGQIEVKPAEH